MTRAAGCVHVEAAGRLHFGVLDLRGTLGRWFGGIGTAAPAPTLLLSASLSDSTALECSGEDADRAHDFGSRFLRHHGVTRGGRIHVARGLPQHAGFGSGTQLALAVARALAELHGLDTDVTALAKAVERTRRSGVGMWAFSGGGFVVEGGRKRDTDTAPLVARVPFPASWRCVVAVPDAPAGISGEAEASAFSELPPPPPGDEERVAHLVLMALLPALVEDDLATFGATLTRIQEITGRWFAPVQGGTFAAGPSADLIQRLSSWGAVGVGQSSWGPAVYAIVNGDPAATALAARVRTSFGNTGAVFEGPFRNEGARVWRT